MTPGSERLAVVPPPPPSALTRMKLMLPTAPAGPAESITIRQTCGPAASCTPDRVTVVHDCQPPVSGMERGPVLSTPSTSMWNVPPRPADATRASIVYVPATPTVAEYCNHSPAKIQPTL